MTEDEKKSFAKYWYLKPFTAHPKFRAIAERQFEELWGEHKKSTSCDNQKSTQKQYNTKP